MDGSRSFLSVIIVTHGRPDLLKKCISSLTRASLGVEISVRVEINGADAPTREICAELASTLPLRVREFEERVAPGDARNRALADSDDSEWVYFLDDDAYVEEGHFAEFRAILARHPEAGVIGGPNLTPPGSAVFQRASGVALASRLATFFSSARYRARGAERLASEEDLILCNLFVRRSELGPRPFPSDFLCGEENWLLLGLRGRGVPMIYAPSLHVWHERRALVSELGRQVFRYGEGRARNWVERPGTLRLPHLAPALCLVYTAVTAFGFALGSFSPWGLLPFGVYLLLCLGAAFASAGRSNEGTSVALAAAPIFALVHTAYGLGTLAGLRRRAIGMGLAAISAATFWIYWPLISADPVLARDDVRTLRYLHGWNDFLDFLKNGEIDKVIVYQPLRDLSLFIDAWLRSVLGFGTYHLTNWILWCGIVVVAYSILRQVISRQRPWLPLAAAALFAVHPIGVGSVGWLSARKHLLATLFALLATRRLVRFRYRGGAWFPAALVCTFFYGLSVLSHPIAVLWPFWALYYARQADETSREPVPPALWLVGALPLPIAAVALVWSFIYYRGLYVAHTLNLKFVASPSGGPPISLLAHGRYLFNLLFPFRLGAVYYPGAAWNMAGLFALPFLFAALLTGRRGREGWGWLAFYFFPLLPVTLLMTNVFVSDTYALLPAFGLCVLFARYLESRSGREDFGGAKRDSLRLVGFAVAFVVLGGLSRAQADFWSSDRELWTHTDRIESSPRSLTVHSQLLIEAGDPISARELLAKLHDWDPDNAEYPGLFARAIYLDPRLSDDERLELFSREDQTGSLARGDAWFNYFLGATLARAGRFREADERFRVVMERPEAFEDELGKAVAEVLGICHEAGATDCDAREHRLRERIAASAILRSHWDEAAFRARELELGRRQAEHR